MDDLSAFERQLRSEVQRAFVPARPVDVASIVRTAATQSPKWRFQSMFSAAKFVVAGAIVALFGALLLTGVLTQPGDDQPPAVGASASAPGPTGDPHTEPERTVEADVDASPSAMPSTSSTFAPIDVPGAEVNRDLLPGVELVVRDFLWPGTYLVLHDGVRQISDDEVADGEYVRGMTGSMSQGIEAGPDGSLWVFDWDGFFRVGEPSLHEWSNVIEGGSAAASDDVEVTREGTLWWADAGTGSTAELRSFDGSRWTISMFKPPVGVVDEIEQLPDGTLLASWWGPKGKRTIERFVDGDWQVVHEIKDAGNKQANLVAGRDSEVWLQLGPDARRQLRRIQLVADGAESRAVPLPAERLEWMDAGPDGALWAVFGDPAKACKGRRCRGSDEGRHDMVLGRYDGSEWQTYDRKDGLPHFWPPDMAVAGDGTLWINDGSTVYRVSPAGIEQVGPQGSDIRAGIAVSPNGIVWLKSGNNWSGLIAVDPSAISTEETTR